MSLDVIHEKDPSTAMPLAIWSEQIEYVVPKGHGSYDHTFPTKTFGQLAKKVGVKVYTALSSWSVGYDNVTRAFNAAAVETSAEIDFNTGQVTPRLQAMISDGNEDDGLSLKAKFIVFVDWSETDA